MKNETNARAATLQNEETIVSDEKNIDGGYGWVIVSVSFFAHMIVDGVSFSVGVLIVDFYSYFGGSKSQISWVSSVLNGTYLMMGPFAGVVANIVGFRTTAILGSLICSVAYILAAFSPNVELLILTYGAMGGLGFGLFYLSTTVMVGFYFTKRRALAAGIGVCGSGIGGFVFAPLCYYLLEQYTWKGACWIISGITLQGVILGALLRPVNKTGTHLENIKNENVSAKVCEDYSTNECVCVEYCTGSNNGYTGRCCIADLASNQAIKPYSKASDNIKTNHEKSVSKNTSEEKDKCSVYYVDTLNDQISYSKITEDTYNYCNAIHNQRHTNPVQLLSIKHLNTDIILEHDTNREYSKSNLPRLSFKSTEDNDYKKKDLTQVTLKLNEEDSTMYKGVHEQTRKYMVVQNLQIILSLIKDPVFMLLCLSGFLSMFAFYLPFTFLPDHAIQIGLSGEQGSFLISIIGITNTIFRVIGGIISDIKQVNSLMFLNVSLIIGGIATAVCPYLYNYGLLVIYCILFGYAIAIFVSLELIIVIEIGGKDRMAHGFGMFSMAQGLCALIGSPIAGALYDATGNYTFSFYMAGSTLILAGLINMTLPILKSWLKKK